MIPAIATHGLSKTYPRSWRTPAFEAVRDLSLTIDEGEVFGFIGPNGAGKSTVIKVLTGVLQPTTGRAELFGEDVSLPAARRGLGYVPENPSLYDYLTPLEILTMGLSIHGVRVANRRQHCLQWLERFDLAQVANKRVRSFSKGMTQRVALAHAMAIQPRLLILDEPLSGLDPVGRKDVVDILGEYRGAGGTILLTSHVLHDVERLADRFGLIHRGQLLTIRSPQELAANQADRYVLRYRGGTPILGCREVRPGLFTLDVGAAELPALLAQVNACGGVLQEVKPRVSLETVFFSAICCER